MNFDEPSNADLARLKEILAEHDATTCKACQAPIEFKGCYVSSGMTEEGTDFSQFSVACSHCGEGVMIGDAWSYIESIDDFLDTLSSEWGDDDGP